MFQIAIPKPCHEDWDKMNPNEQGRHCNVCCKTVVDFTSVSDTEVKYFFINKKKEESVCGRFKSEQLHRIKIQLPSNIYTISMPLWKRFLTACLLAFSSMLFSCDALVSNNTLGETIPFVMADDSTAKPAMPQPPAIPLIGFSTYQIPDTSISETCSTIKGDTIYAEGITQGGAMVTPVENIIPSEIVGEPAMIQVDTPQTILTGKVAFDIDTTQSLNRIDTVKPKALKTVSSKCDEENTISL